MDVLLPSFLIPILAAYILLFFSLPSRFYLLRLTPIHLTFHLLVTGILLFTLAACVLPLWEKTPATFIHAIFLSATSFIADIIKTISGKRNVLLLEPDILKNSSFTLSFACAIATLSLLMEFFCKFYRGFIDRLYSQFTGGRVSQLSRLMRSEKPILISLKSKKAYVGYISSISSWRTPDKNITIVPLRSGYRDTNNALHLTNNYETLWGMVKFLNERNAHPMGQLTIKDKKGNIISEMTIHRAREIMGGSAITLKMDDIELSCEWFPELYTLQNHSKEKNKPLKKGRKKRRNTPRT